MFVGYRLNLNLTVGLWTNCSATSRTSPTASADSVFCQRITKEEKRWLIESLGIYSNVLIDSLHLCSLCQEGSLVTRDSHHSACLGPPWQSNTDFYLCRAANGGQGKFKCVAVAWHCQRRYRVNLCQCKYGLREEGSLWMTSEIAWHKLWTREERTFWVFLDICEQARHELWMRWGWTL